MKFRFHRIAVAILALTTTFFGSNAFEKRRAVSTPSDWIRIDGHALEPEAGPPRVLNSVWRMGPNTTWQSTRAAEQLYVRPQLDNPLGISLSTDGDSGLWVWLFPNQPATATLNGKSIDCIGKISPPDGEEAIEISTQKDGVLLRWGDDRMVCSTQNIGGKPAIKTRTGSVNLASIGRDRQSDSVPLSPLWWMSHLMIGGLIAMLFLDSLMALKSRLNRQYEIPMEE